jgi:hypothetical protein
MKGRNCARATFDSYQEMLAHCRQSHPDQLPFGGDPTTELVVMDTEGRVLSCEEILQILDDPSFWREPVRGARWEEEEVAPVAMRHSMEVAASRQVPELREVAQDAVRV